MFIPMLVPALIAPPLLFTNLILLVSNYAIVPLATALLALVPLLFFSGTAFYDSASAMPKRLR